MRDKQPRKPLQKRVDDYLRLTTKYYLVEEITDETVQILVDQIMEAEEELKILETRINRLRRLLAEVQTDDRK